LPLDASRRERDAPIWKLEPSFRRRSCGTRRYKPLARIIKLTEQREITPHKWVHPDEERYAAFKPTSASALCMSASEQPA
jgi:hypothetical protein